MKKLLALVLCVMMFVALIPTAAFAAYDKTDPDQVAEAARLGTEAKNADEDLETAEKALKAAWKAEKTAKEALDSKKYSTSDGEKSYNELVSALAKAQREYDLNPDTKRENNLREAQMNLDRATPEYKELKADFDAAKAKTDAASDDYEIAKAAAALAHAEVNYFFNQNAVLYNDLVEAQAAYDALVAPVVPVIVKPWVVVGNDLTGYYSTSINADAISDLKDSIENMFNGLAVNQTVFGTAQTLHNLADGMVKDLLADVDDYDALDGTTIGHDDLVTNCRAFLKGIIGAQIENYVDKRAASFMNDDGTVDYEDYLNVYTKAVNDAVTSSKAQKGIEAFVYAVTALKMQDAINDKTDDLKDEIIDWNDYGSKWSEFGFSQDIDDLFGAIAGPDEDYTFVKPTGLTDAEGLTLDAILNP